ncbi:hypothetical protein [uncultured Erythrobacter sp.]|uniref:hypothetical protein n=1 Tax=uncultured Erythrobacter sp. TaxID=263913 RepID=UPI00260792AF|nr:hypothetical protein [uncultured Erythrobacter sp.]
MAFDRNYDMLIDTAAALGQYDGYLDTAGQKEFQQVQASYAALRNKAAYDILADKPDMDLVYERIRGDLNSIAEEEPDLASVCEFVAEDLIEKLQEESGKSPALRAVKRYGGPAILGVLGLIYAGLFFYNDVTIDQPIETKEGLLQHAAAYDKARTFESLMGTRTRRGGAIKGLLFWPFEPDDAEFEAAGNFAGLSLDGLQALTEQGVTCNTQYLLTGGEYLSEAQMTFADEVSEYLQAESTVWEEQAFMTPLPMMVENFGCPVDPASPTPAAE